MGAIVIRSRYDEDTESAEVATSAHTLYRMGVFLEGRVIYLFKFEKCYKKVRFGYNKFKLTIKIKILQ
jgi:hypothetical protein